MTVERVQPVPVGESQAAGYDAEPVVVVLPDDDVMEPVEEAREEGFYDNLAEYLPDEELAVIGGEIVQMFDADKKSRGEWERTYRRGIKLMGMTTEDLKEPFEGACGVFHPLLAEAVVRFQSHAIMETFPPGGPAKTRIIGEETVEKRKQAARIREDLNYLTTDGMPEYRDEHERMLFYLPLGGSAFKKVWYDPAAQRPRAQFVPADEVVVSYGATSLADCTRISHLMRMPANEIRKLIVSGFYRDVGDIDAPAPVYSETREAEDRETGIRREIAHDDRLEVIEMQVDLDLPEPYNDPQGVARPYVVTVLRDGRVLGIRRNWREDDPTFARRQHFVHYQYMPGFGFYGIGLIHLIGGLSKTATSVLRQLVDAGAFANVPAGFKAKGFRVKGESEPLRPGEWRDIDVPGDKVRDALFPLPYKEPSTVLYQLLGTVTEEGRRLGSIADVDIRDINRETPVGTTLALMERSLKIMSAVQARLHRAMGLELRLIAEIVGTQMPPEYPFETDPGANRRQDYDGRVDVIPVSDPNASTMAQKVVQYQAAMQAAQSAPHIYDLRELHRGMLDAMQIPNAEKIIPLEDEMKPMDPVTENMAILRQQPVKVFPHQDHAAHIAVHMAALQDPKLREIVGQSPTAAAVMAAAQAHITEHVAWQYRREVERALGAPLPETDKPLPPDVEESLAPLIAEAARRVLVSHKDEVKAAKARQAAEDPLVQIELRKLELQRQKQEADARFKAAQMELERERIKAQERIAGAKIGADLATEAAEVSMKEKQAGVKAAIDIVRTKTQADVQREVARRADAEKESE